MVAEYGSRLLCVRYRYDAERRRRYKTVGLIVDEVPWEPPRRKSREIMKLRVGVSSATGRGRCAPQGGAGIRRRECGNYPMKKSWRSGRRVASSGKKFMDT